MTKNEAPAAPAYRLSTRKYCPTCGGKAQDPQVTGATLGDDDVELYPGESCDEPYHDTTDPLYVED